MLVVDPNCLHLQASLAVRWRTAAFDRKTFKLIIATVTVTFVLKESADDAELDLRIYTYV